MDLQELKAELTHWELRAFLAEMVDDYSQWKREKTEADKNIRRVKALIKEAEQCG